MHAWMPDLHLHSVALGRSLVRCVTRCLMSYTMEDRCAEDLFRLLGGLVACHARKPGTIFLHDVETNTSTGSLRRRFTPVSTFRPI